VAIIQPCAPGGCNEQFSVEFMIFLRLFGCVWFVLAAQFAALTVVQPARCAPPPEVVSLVTKDGVQLQLTYFPSAKRAGTPEAKQVAPVVLLHDHKETRAIFNPLAQRLQTIGEGKPKEPSFAAITVDLRGHGESTKQIFADGSQVDLDAARLNKQALMAMAAYDMEAVRSFLVGKNDAGELNLNKLCIVGAGMGASVAANWAAQDWAAPPLAIGKQGQDVKALVLISPRWSYNGLSFQAPLRFRELQRNVAWMLVYGAEDPKVKADVERIRKQLARSHPEAKNAAAGQRPSSLQVVALPSKLQGSTLLTKVGGPIEEKVVAFLVQQVAKVPHPWTGRLNRLPQ
jgi:pimeloyl-ACP methyl ester carboxylesterase